GIESAEALARAGCSPRAGRVIAHFFGLTFGLGADWRTLPREVKPPHSAAHVSWLASGDSLAPARRLPCSANIAPCGSMQRVIQCPGVNSNGPCTTLPPPALTAAVAVSMSATLK